MQLSSSISEQTRSGASRRLEAFVLGSVPYAHGRSVQENFIDAVRRGERGEGIIFCEHEPVITLGRRTACDDINPGDPYWNANGIEIVRVSRGGGPTFHGPGQLMIYPVVKLRERRLGVRDFVSSGLAALANVVRSYGIPATSSLQPAGIWVSEPNTPSSKKLGWVGLHIEHGITNHGFSLSVTGDKAPFVRFRPCSLAKVEISSIEQELAPKPGAPEPRGDNFSMPEITAKVFSQFQEILE